MPTVETQTSWSWLKDIALIAEFTSSHRVTELSVSQQEIEETLGKSTTAMTVGEPTVESTKRQDCSRVQLQDEPPLVLSPLVGDESIPIPVQHTSEDQLPMDFIVTTDKRMNEKRSKHSESSFLLPQILPQVSITENQEEKNHQTQRESLKLPTILDQLQQVQFLSDITSSPENSDQEDFVVEDTNTRSLEQYYDLKLPNLPWPSILQYLRESESYAAMYFSLQNKSLVEKRIEGAGDHFQGNRKENECSKTSQQGIGLSRVYTSGCLVGNSWSEESDSGSEEITTEKATNEQELIMKKCEFCGLQSSTYSQLATSSLDEDVKYCCEEYKEFCIFVATSMKQQVDKLCHGPPQKISVKQTKKQIKKTAEQRAFAVMCRKRKWEQLLQMKLQMTEKQKKNKRQTGTIQFSLLADSTLDMGWMVRPQSTTSYQTPARRRAEAKRRKVERNQQIEGAKKINMLFPDVLKRLQANTQDTSSLGNLDQRHYNNGKLFLTLLPDKTGQCYYPSGNKAVVIFSPYQGVLAYMIYEDGGDTLLAYLDELGRACCYNSDGLIKLHFTQCEGTFFSPKGLVLRNWTWGSDSASAGSFQPVILTLNKQVSIKIHNRGSVSIIFSSGNKLLKFSIGCKLNENESLSRIKDLSWIDMRDKLQQNKRRVSELLSSLQSNSYLAKLNKMKSVYDPGSSRQHQANKQTRRRTRSSGNLPLQAPLQKLSFKSTSKPAMY